MATVVGKIELSNLKAGDLFAFVGSRSCGRFAGKITKVNRVTFDLDLRGGDADPIVTRIRFNELLGGECRVLRDGRLLSTTF